MPSGSSMLAAVRASVSATTRKPLPSSSEAGSSRENAGPTIIRAMCGTTRPTQPMMPATDTAAAVASVAAATSITRSRQTLTPSASASSSGRLSRSTRQRSSSIGTSPARMTGPVTCRSCVVMLLSPPISQKVMEGSWVIGSATVLISAMPAPSNAPTATPASTRTSTGSCRRTSAAMPRTSSTASSPPAKASPCTPPSGSPT